METIKSYGNIIIEPQSGFLASGLEGKGRMEEPEAIVDILDHYFDQSSKSLEGKRIMITAGPTYEKIDPVRFIGNYSSGKMGFALAEECAAKGAEVTLIAGPVALSTVNDHILRIDVESCEDMYNAAITHFASCDAAILCAAVADFRPDHIADRKIKREKDDLVLHLAPTHDIAAELGRIKKQGQVLVGFALETNDEDNNAKSKLERKNLDFIVLNSLRNEGTCFRSDENQIKIISRYGTKEYPKKKKDEVAADIVEELSVVMSN